jgi:hypothetical protein
MNAKEETTIPRKSQTADEARKTQSADPDILTAEDAEDAEKKQRRRVSG